MTDEDNIHRGEFARTEAQVKEHDRQLTTLVERDRNRERNFEDIQKSLRELNTRMETVFAPLAKAVEQQAGGLLDMGNRLILMAGRVDKIETAEAINTGARITATMEIDRLIKAWDELQGEMKTSISLRKDFADAQKTIIRLEDAEKANTEARVELKTQLQTLAGLIKWLIALAPLVGLAVGIATFYGLSQNHK